MLGPSRMRYRSADGGSIAECGIELQPIERCFIKGTGTGFFATIPTLMLQTLHVSAALLTATNALR